MGLHEVPLITPADAAAAHATLIDVRSEKSRVEFGTIAAAILVDKADVQAQFGGEGRDRDEPIVVFCGSVKGSGPVADQLKDLGYTNVKHIEGGYPAWKEQGLPTVG